MLFPVEVLWVLDVPLTAYAVGHGFHERNPVLTKTFGVGVLWALLLTHLPIAAGLWFLDGTVKALRQAHGDWPWAAADVLAWLLLAGLVWLTVTNLSHLAHRRKT